MQATIHEKNITAGDVVQRLTRLIRPTPVSEAPSTDIVKPSQAGETESPALLGMRAAIRDLEECVVALRVDNARLRSRLVRASGAAYAAGMK